MIGLRQIAGGLVVLFASTIPAHAQVLTVTGGTIAATAQAGETGYVQQTDTPTPASVQPLGSTSSSATANGTAVPFFPPGQYPTSATATGTVNVTNDASGVTTLDLSGRSTLFLVQAGPGSWCCGTAEAIDTVFFSLSAPAELALDYTQDYLASNLNPTQARLVDTATQSTLYYVDNRSSPVGVTDLQLPAGLYAAILQDPIEPSGGSPLTQTAEFTITVAPTPAPVPLPGTIWLLSSGLVGLSALRRRSKNARAA